MVRLILFSSTGCVWLPGCRAGWAGFHGPWGCSFGVAGMVRAGQPDGRACRRVMAAVISLAQVPPGQVAEPVLQVMGIRLRCVRRLLRRAQEAQEPVRRLDRAAVVSQTRPRHRTHGITTRCTRTESPRHLPDGRRKITTSTTSDAAGRTCVAHVEDSTETARDNIGGLPRQRRLAGLRSDHAQPAARRRIPGQPRLRQGPRRHHPPRPHRRCRPRRPARPRP
jgi:hypothetical protein